MAVGMVRVWSGRDVADVEAFVVQGGMKLAGGAERFAPRARGSTLLS